MKQIAILLVLSMSVPLAMADDDRLQLFLPKDSTLVLSKDSRESGPHAVFSAQTWISGTFYARWPEGDAYAENEEPEFTIVPDAASMDRLPYFFAKDRLGSHPYKVDSLSIVNGRAAARLVIGDSELERLLAQEIKIARAPGSFLISNYEVGVECDHSWARASLEKFQAPAATAPTQTLKEGC